MQKRPLVAICLAFLAAAMIILAGKSCADDIAKTNQKHKKPVTTTSMPPQFFTGSATPPPVPEYIYEDNEATQTETQTATNTDFYTHFVTNQFGEIIETTTTTAPGGMYYIVTDENGNIKDMQPVTTNAAAETATTLSQAEQASKEQALADAMEQASRQAVISTYDPSKPIEIPFVNE